MDIIPLFLKIILKHIESVSISLDTLTISKDILLKHVWLCQVNFHIIKGKCSINIFKTEIGDVKCLCFAFLVILVTLKETTLSENASWDWNWDVQE